MGTIAVGERNKMLDAFAGIANYVATSCYVQLHTGDPGAAGTANVAANSTRVQATFTGNAASGTFTNSADVLFANLANAETVSFVSVWSALTLGTFKGSAAITAAVIAVTDNLRLPAGQVQLSIT